VLLAPGSGSSSSHPTLLALAATLDPLPVRRMDFPYRLAGRHFPDPPSVLVDAVCREAAALAAETGVPVGRVVLGGRSMGGRMCSVAVAEGLPASGLVLIGYPLHPPGKPDVLRTEHFGALDLPCLFISGTRDEFGTPEELTDATAAIPGPVQHVWIEGGRHELARVRDRTAVVDAVTNWFAGRRG
jgi:hypothetical protein